MKQNNMLAMILAGGRGSRLHELTNKVAKPAVSYGGKYRIVDFPLSNCANSGVDIVGVLTQYESVLLNSYVAAGGRWGLDAREAEFSFSRLVKKPMLIWTYTEVLLTLFLRISTLLTNTHQNIFWFSPATISTRWIMTRCWITTRK